MSRILMACLVVAALPLLAQQPKENEKVYSVKDDGVTAPVLLYKVEPKYTDQARDAKIEGTVVLSVEITPGGVADNVVVKESLEPGLDQSAVDAVAQWRFKPGMKDGKAVRVKASIEVNFRLT